MTMLKKTTLLFLLLYMACGVATSLGPPGKPTLTNCRSPEKETFTCWWKSGSDGGLPTTYALFYLKDNSDILYECSDYHTAGQNSCFFNKNETSVWVNYNIIVVATNEIGRTFSDPVDVDVAYIVQPHTPVNVTMNVMEDKGRPFLRVSWDSPHNADIRSGWITLVYELRSKMEGEEEWEEHFPGQQKTFNIFSIRSGSSYLVQVRCKPDHGFWSEWSSTTKITVPEYFFGERSLWILIVVFSFLVFLILAWILMNSQSLKHFILPPVPGPKIKGFDHQCLKDGSYNNNLNTLMIPEFPAHSSSNYEDPLVEYLEVFASGEQEFSTEEGQKVQDHYFTSENSTCDSDSGQGTYSSHSLLMDKCEAAKIDEPNINCKENLEPELSHNSQNKVIYEYSSDKCNGRVKTAHSDINISKLTNEIHISFSSNQSTQYVEVQTVNEEDMVLLKPVESVQSPIGGCPHVQPGADYSRVKRVENGNLLLLEKGVGVLGASMDECFNDRIEIFCMKERDNMSTNALKQQDASLKPAPIPPQEQKPFAANGYVDTAMFSLSI